MPISELHPDDVVFLRSYAPSGAPHVRPAEDVAPPLASTLALLAAIEARSTPAPVNAPPPREPAVVPPDLDDP